MIREMSNKSIKLLQDMLDEEIRVVSQIKNKNIKIISKLSQKEETIKYSAKIIKGEKYPKETYE